MLIWLLSLGSALAEPPVDPAAAVTEALQGQLGLFAPCAPLPSGADGRREVTLLVELGAPGGETRIQLANPTGEAPDPLSGCVHQALSALDVSSLAREEPQRLAYTLSFPEPSAAPTLAAAAAPAPSEPIQLGALDKSLIDAEIKRHMNQVRYCYQRELTKDPFLSGKLVIKFVIARDGTVSKADVKSSTLGNPAMEGCVADRFMRFQFPEPDGGGIVIVSYPFIFSPGHGAPPAAVLPAARECAAEAGVPELTPLVFKVFLEDRSIYRVDVGNDLYAGAEACLLEAFDGYRYPKRARESAFYEVSIRP